MATPISSTVTGIAGFDTAAAVDGLLAFNKLEISQAQKKQDAEVAKQDAWATINSAMLSFKATAQSMADSTKFFAYGASLTSSSSSVAAGTLLDVSGTDAVSAGKHAIVVEQVAQAERLSSSTAVKDSAGALMTSDQASLGLSGSFQIEGSTISVSATDNLQNIAANINQQSTGTGVSASIIKVGSSDFRLVLASNSTGAAGFSLSGADLDGVGALANLQLGAVGQSNARSSLQQPQDAKVSIDGLSILRSSNTISDALNGVTLNLKQADPAVTVNMDISIDTAALRNNVQTFVDAYNNVQSLVNSQFKFDSATGSTGVLAGESVLTSIQSALSNSLLQSIPGLASDRSSMVAVGLEPDQTGQLTINPTLFDKFINSDPTAIRDVFVASGSSSNNQIQFLTSGLNTASGTYQVNMTQAALKASVASSPSTDLVNSTLASNEQVTITESGNQQQAVVNLLAGQGQSDILAALNAEFAKESTDVHQMSNSLGSGLTTSTTLANLGFGIAAGDTINISGTNRQGGLVSSQFAVLDPTKDNIGTLLSSIQSAFNQQVVASLDATGNIRISDAQSGTSQLTVNLSAQNQGGGSLSFGTDQVVTEGRYTMNLTAVAQGNGVMIQGKSFGTSSDFNISQSVNGLGIADQFVGGQSVSGTINGAAAKGSGQLLIGSSGSTDGLGLLYTGSATGNVGDITVGVGLGAKLEGVLDLFANPFTGMIQNSIAYSQTTFDTLTQNITSAENQMAQKRVSLEKSFTAMQQALASIQQSGSFLTQQINAQNAPQN